MIILGGMSGRCKGRGHKVLINTSDRDTLSTYKNSLKLDGFGSNPNDIMENYQKVKCSHVVQSEL